MDFLYHGFQPTQFSIYVKGNLTDLTFPNSILPATSHAGSNYHFAFNPAEMHLPFNQVKEILLQLFTISLIILYYLETWPCFFLKKKSLMNNFKSSDPAQIPENLYFSPLRENCLIHPFSFAFCFVLFKLILYDWTSPGLLNFIQNLDEKLRQIFFFKLCVQYQQGHFYPDSCGTLKNSERLPRICLVRFPPPPLCIYFSPSPYQSDLIYIKFIRLFFQDLHKCLFKSWCYPGYLPMLLY